MRFRAYPRVSANAGSAGGQWVATEKIHGANLVVGVAGEEVRFGKRKAWLAREDAFFGWQLIAAELEERVRAVVRAVGAGHVVCFGELFGGGYPHPDVAEVPGLRPVQTGVSYAPDLRWALFDVLVSSGDEDGELLAFVDVEELAIAAGLLVPPVLGRGRRDDLDRIPVEAQTAVPTRLGLPPIAGNRREGVVMKPDRPMPYGGRPIMKRKRHDFDDSRFDDAQRWDPGHLDVVQLAAWARRCVNPARIASARSKVGTEPAAILEEVVLDVATDLELVYASAWRTLGVDGEATVLADIREATRALQQRS